MIFDNVQKRVDDEYKRDESNAEIKKDLWLQTVFVQHSPNRLILNPVIRKYVQHKQIQTQ